MKTKTKSIMTICLAVALVVAAVVGTIAYMTATDSVTNTFTVGDFNKPTTDPTDPDKTISLKGYIYEPSWVDKSKLVPGDSVAKDPYVGIGKGSEEAYVYVYIKNNLLTVNNKHVTFTLDSDWEAVVAAEIGTDTGKYAEGLFRYKTTLKPDADTDAWTTAIFKKVDVPADIASSEFVKENPTMTVSAFIHQAKDDNGAIDTATIEQAAKDWAGTL